MDSVRRTAMAVVSAGVILALGAACGPMTSPPSETADASVSQVGQRAVQADQPAARDGGQKADRTAARKGKKHKRADTGTPPLKRLAVVGYVVYKGSFSHSIGQPTTSKHTDRGRYTLVVSGLNPGCKTKKPKVFLTPAGMEGLIRSSVSTDCKSGDVTVKVKRNNFDHHRINGGFYVAIYRGAGPRPAGLVNPRHNRVAVGRVNTKGKASKVVSDHGVRGRRHGKGRFDVTVRGLDKGCVNNAPLVLVHPLRSGVPLAIGAGVDCQSGNANVPVNFYTKSGRRTNVPFTFTVYQGQPISETSKHVARRCMLAVDATAGC